MTGRITTERTVWCGECTEWLQLPARSIVAFRKEIRRQGWRQHHKEWCCPACKVEHVKDLVTAQSGRESMDGIPP